jgi:hypothetical protein
MGEERDLCYCGEERIEHDVTTGRCRYCTCDGFEFDQEATLMAQGMEAAF